MPKPGTFDWPPHRFKEGLEWCDRFDMTRRLTEDVLRNLYTAIVKDAGQVGGRMRVKDFYVALSNSLELFFSKDAAYARLKAERKEEAIWDLAGAAYFLMDQYRIISPPVVT